MTREQLVSLIRERSSLLCVGLDTDINKIPAHLRSAKNPLFEFNKAIIDATAQYTVAFKINTAFYEAHGASGWEQMQLTADYIGNSHFKIADAKRGDIGNTADMYARAFFSEMDFDSVTLSPYMGRDSIQPFLEYEDKWAIVLGHTSNQGALDFQTIRTESGELLYEKMIMKMKDWSDRIMFVVGATKSEAFKSLRAICPQHFFLVPGVGAQGGDMESVIRDGHNSDAGLLINSSRGIIYASSESDFAEKAGMKAFQIQEEMRALLDKFGV